jgi:hypothetical protein
MITPARAPAPKAAWIIDFEFRADAGERPIVWCLVALGVFSGRELRFWRDDLLKMRRAPFDTGADVVVAAYFAQAEWSCFGALGWPLPAQPICLFAEFRAFTNRYIPKGVKDLRGLYDALEWAKLPRGDVARKNDMRELAKTKARGMWSETEKEALIHYCADDVHRTAALYLRMLHLDFDWPQARFRGLYTLAVASRAGREAVRRPIVPAADKRLGCDQTPIHRGDREALWVSVLRWR